MNHSTLKRLTPLLALTASVLILFLTSAISAVVSPTAAPDFTVINASVVQQMQALRIPGLALAIVHGDQIVDLNGFGVANPSGRAVTPQMPFMVVCTLHDLFAPLCWPRADRTYQTGGASGTSR